MPLNIVTNSGNAISKLSHLWILRFTLLKECCFFAMLAI
ncbi:MAG: hypothetical protein ACI88A_003722 [Paraglaciecola sp.]